MAPCYDDGQVRLFCGDARGVLGGLATGSVDCVVTSPPYWRKRDYGIVGQYGLEETFEDYVDTLRSVFTEIHRVLTDRGTLWLNLGDSHIAVAPGPRTNPGTLNGTPNSRTVPRGFGEKRGLAAKNLVGIPWRVAFALQAEGWILRSEIIWAKPNGMPESVTDRPTRTHEQLFLFTKQRRYHYDAQAIREESSPQQQAHNRRYARPDQAHTSRAATTGQPGTTNAIGIHARGGPGGRNARSVWSIGPRPSRHGHHAGFPLEIPLRAIAAGCPEGGIVLDPFSGSGTTLIAARHLGRSGIGIDLQPAYHAIAIDRLAEEVQP